MQIAVVAILVALCLAAVVAQGPPRPQVDLFPQTADGFDTVWLNDQSFVTELNVEYVGPHFENMTYYVYGSEIVRTVYPGEKYYVGATPNGYWHGIPFIDFHTFQDQNGDVWGFGPVSAFRYPLSPNPIIPPPWWHHFNFTGNFTQTFPPGYDIVVVTTKVFPNNPHGVFFLDQPIAFQGTFSAVHVAQYQNNVIGYFAGFFPSPTQPNITQFGLVRAHFNTSVFQTGDDTSGPGWTYSTTSDIAVIYNQTELVDFNNDFKPILVHLNNVTTDPTQVYIAVVEPAFDMITLVQANWQNPNIPLAVSPLQNWRPGPDANIVSAVAYNNLLFVGVAVDGMGTGWISVLNTPSLSPNATIMLPANYSNPQALVIDYGFNPEGLPLMPHLYVGMNGGPAVLRINLSVYNSANKTYPITGYQLMPHYLHRVWVGQVSPFHVYFATNEQHAKVFRVAKTDFCDTGCMEFGFCKNGECVCSQGFDKKGEYCEWHQIEKERHSIEVRKGGEVALGILFALTFVAGAYGWYLVWKNRRGQYQAV